MTLPNTYRYCDSCGFEGDASKFIKVGPDGVAIRSKFKQRFLDQLRNGAEQADDAGYYPYAEFCPMCGFNRESDDASTDAECRAKGRLIRAQRLKAQKKARNRGRLMMALFILVIALAFFLIIKFV